MQRFKKAKDAKYKTEGGGGTDMRLIFDYLNKYYPDYFDGVIVLTDMYTPFPTKQQVNGRKVLWANCSGEDFTKRIPNGIGKVIDVFDTSKLDCNWEDQGAAV
jgi:predicted metal-dependent peptidase